MKTILVTNLGSTSTKAAIYHDLECAYETTLRHPASDLSQFKSILDQKEYRKQALESWLESIHVSFASYRHYLCSRRCFKTMCQWHLSC